MRPGVSASDGPEQQRTTESETGTATDGAVFDNRALWIGRLRADGLIDAVWTIDLDHEQMVAFWADRAVTAAP